MGLQIAFLYPEQGMELEVMNISGWGIIVKARSG